MMNDVGTILGVISLIVSVIGLAPIIGSLFLKLSNYLPAKRFFNLKDKEVIDIVVTTSDYSSPASGITVRRPTTGIGQIKGIASASKAIGLLYPKKNIEVLMSRQITHQLSNDLIILGGPLRNNIARDFLEEFLLKNPNLDFEFDDFDCKFKLGNKIVTSPDITIDNSGEKIKKDYCLVIMWHNPFSNNKRLILCAGFTSFGTAGGSSWLFENVLMPRGLFFKKPHNLKSNSPNFVAMIKVRVQSNQIIGIECERIVEF